jgi:hypothetical protein
MGLMVQWGPTLFLVGAEFGGVVIHLTGEPGSNCICFLLGRLVRVLFVIPGVQISNFPNCPKRQFLVGREFMLAAQGARLIRGVLLSRYKITI